MIGRVIFLPRIQTVSRVATRCAGAMKLTSFRDKDRTHLRDLISVGLVDESWRLKLPDELAARLQSLLDAPDG